MLDIIIPTYKDKEGLIKTLSSIPNYKEIVVTVIDDDSNLDYSDLYNKFNFNMQLLSPNSGPGVARQIGMMVTEQPYIMFLDCGDTLETNAMSEVLGIINIHPDIPVFSWQYTSGDGAYSIENNNIHGRVYQRAFLDKYNITFSEKGSYANEDVGFNHACRLILTTIGAKVFHLRRSIVNYDTTSLKSLTRKNNHSFLYKDQNLGLAYNAIHAYNIAKAAGAEEQLLVDYVSDIMGSQYFFFIRTMHHRPEYGQYSWDGAKYFYDNLFKQVVNTKQYMELAQKRMLIFYRKMLKQKKENFKNHINFKQFFSLLENDKVPEEYKYFMYDKNNRIITLCGSTRFKEDFERVNRELTLQGNIVISVGCFGHAGDSFTNEQKVMLDEIHKRKIDLADAIYVINKDHYIGSSTKSEIEYAREHNKEIIYMVP